MNSIYNQKIPGWQPTGEHMTANQRQVGGSHYAAKHQHWDIVVEHDLNYFEGQITKYVMRCRKKNGLEDLQKAHHFIEKYMQVWSEIADRLPATQIVVHPRVQKDMDVEYQEQREKEKMFQPDGFFADGTQGYQCVHCRKVVRAGSPLGAFYAHQCPVAPAPGV